MATETLHLAASLSGTVTNPQNALGNTPGTWAGTVDDGVSWAHTWSLANPSLPNLTREQQTVAVVARKGSNTDNPTVSFTVTRNGVTLATSPTVTVTSTSGQTITASWFGEGSSQGLEVTVNVTGPGGKPSARNSAQVSMATWTAQVEAAVVPVVVVTSGEARAVASATAVTTGTLDPVVVTTSGTASATAQVSGATSTTRAQTGTGQARATTDTSTSTRRTTAAQAGAQASTTGVTGTTRTATGTASASASASGITSVQIASAARTTGTARATATATGQTTTARTSTGQAPATLTAASVTGSARNTTGTAVAHARAWAFTLAPPPPGDDPITPVGEVNPGTTNANPRRWEARVKPRPPRPGGKRRAELIPATRWEGHLR